MRDTDTDIDLLLDFVIWRCRSGNLPPDVQAAAFRLAELKGFAPPTGVPRRISDGRYRLSVFDRYDGMEDSRPLAMGEAVDQALGTDPLYMLISDVGEAIAQGWEAPAREPSIMGSPSLPVMDAERRDAIDEILACAQWPSGQTHIFHGSVRLDGERVRDSIFAEHRDN